MKKIICVLLILCDAFLLCACSGGKKKTPTPLDAVLDCPNQEALISRLGKPNEEGNEKIGGEVLYGLLYRDVSGFEYEGRTIVGDLIALYKNDDKSKLYEALWQKNNIQEERFIIMADNIIKVLDDRFGKPMNEKKTDIESVIIWKVDNNNSLAYYDYFYNTGEIVLCFGPAEMVEKEFPL